MVRAPRFIRKIIRKIQVKRAFKRGTTTGQRVLVPSGKTGTTTVSLSGLAATQTSTAVSSTPTRTSGGGGGGGVSVRASTPTTTSVPSIVRVTQTAQVSAPARAAAIQRQKAITAATKTQVAQRPTTRPIGIVTSAEPTRKLERFGSRLQTTRQKLKTRQREEPTVLRGAAQTGIGIVSGVLPSAIFVRDIVTQPKETIIGFGKGVQVLATQPEVRQQVFGGIKQTIKQEPALALGFVATEVAFLKGTGAVSKAAQTTRISKAVTQPTKFLAVQKSVSTGAVTDVVFKTPLGEVGIARAFTKVSPSFSETVVVGRVGKKGIIFPTGKQVIKKQRTFISFEKTVTKPGIAKISETLKGGLQTIKDLPIQKSIGVGGIAISKGKTFKLSTAIKTPFIAGGFAITRGGKTLSAARLALPKKQLRGVVGIITRAKDSTGGIKTVGAIPIKGISTVSTTQVSQSITKAIGSIPTRTPKLIRTSSPKTITAQTKQVTSISIQQPQQKQLISTKQKQVISTKGFQTLKQPLALRTPTRTRARQRGVSSSRLAQIPAQILLQRAATKPAQILKQPQTQRARQRQRSILRLQGISTGFRTPRIPISITKIPKGFKIKRKAKEPKTSFGLFPVLVRRRKKFRQIGIGRTIGEAISIGKERVGSTLAATFKIQGVRATGNIPTPVGFRIKNGLFIERRSKRLSRVGETIEIQQAKRRKKK